tara:strand:+ start:733 stop:1053 length:321 start_codon:yes stop_codon:yes gene_type:complete
MSDEIKTARSYRGTVVDDNAVVSINLRWLGQGLVLCGSLVYCFLQLVGRITELEDKMSEANKQIGDLLNKHIVEERSERAELAEKIAFYEKEFNINPLSWGKKKRK